MRSAVGAVAVTILAGACQTAPVRPSPPSGLVREGARPTAIRTGNIDADGDREAVVASVSRASGSTGIPASYLEVFDLRKGQWRRVFEGHGPAPPGASGAPQEMLQGDEGFVAQSVQVVELVDFEGDRAAEIVVGIASAGATAGPVELWILTAAGDGGLRTELYERTERGGELVVEGDQLRFSFPVYRPADPGCCPSVIETQTIGRDPTSGRIGILERDRTPL
jgi:hypothetical protein